MQTSQTKARVIAYYLPQFHPIPENDEWWGKGFTEWTNVAKAKPLFRGHWQPHFPADLSYYDLRVPEVREAQAELAQTHGIEGFCYYHYWFGDGRQVLERPINEVIATGNPNFPFCLCWANETWKGVWFGDGRTLIEQKFGGRSDLEKHFEYLLPIFSDSRYMTVEEKPIFQILSPNNRPNTMEVTDQLRELAHKAGFKGLYLIAGYREEIGWDPRKAGFDAIVDSNFLRSLTPSGPFSVHWFVNRLLTTKSLHQATRLQTFLKRYYRTITYDELIKNLRIQRTYPWDHIPCAYPNWDNTPRSGIKGYVVTGSTPSKFEEHLKECIEYVSDKPTPRQIVFIKSWNEWAEGNYLEPDTKYGSGYLEVVKGCVSA